jgi:hypothetical protein
MFVRFRDLEGRERLVNVRFEQRTTVKQNDRCVVFITRIERITLEKLGKESEG